MSGSSTGMDVRSSMLVHPIFPVLTTASPALQDALKDGFGEPVLAREMAEPYEFPYFDNRQKRFFLVYKKVNLAPHPVVDFVCLSKYSQW